MGHTKRLHQLKQGELFHLKIENFEFFLTFLRLAISYFSGNLPLHKREFIPL